MSPGLSSLVDAMLDLYAINIHLESKSGHVDLPLPATAKDGDRPSVRNLGPKVDEPNTVLTLENSVNEGRYPLFCMRAEAQTVLAEREEIPKIEKYYISKRI